MHTIINPTEFGWAAGAVAAAVAFTCAPAAVGQDGPDRIRASDPFLYISGEDAIPWAPLVEGDHLEGWSQIGGRAEYEVEDGVVTGTAVPDTPNSFLATDASYGDFILEYEFKVDSRLNSGVQIRSASDPDYKGGQVHGYQVEIDPSDRAWTAGIYDEARRGWLAPLSGEGHAEARAAFRQAEWNKVRVRAVADHIQTWLNDVPAADLVDPVTQEGFIALQVHSIGDESLAGARVQWRNLRIRDLGKHVWRSVMKGNSLDGWTATPGGEWKLTDDGILLGTSPASEERHGILLSDRTFSNFTVRFDFNVTAGNSGFYFRVKPTDHAVAVEGFQAEVDPTMATGGLYETLGRAWVAQPDEGKLAEVYRPGEWSQMVVSAHEGRVAVFVNGLKTVELEDDPGLREGRLGFQLHGGQEMEVRFRDLEILSPSPKG
ncbi:hypothetical protein BH23VER1_BH23VER1_16110 [soil metagenome]